VGFEKQTGPPVDLSALVLGMEVVGQHIAGQHDSAGTISKYKSTLLPKDTASFLDPQVNRAVWMLQCEHGTIPVHPDLPDQQAARDAASELAGPKHLAVSSWM
jgi:hypothetical protein